MSCDIPKMNVQLTDALDEQILETLHKLGGAATVRELYEALEKPRSTICNRILLLRALSLVGVYYVKNRQMVFLREETQG